MIISRNEKIGIIKSLLDAHTMGINSVVSLLVECGYEVVIAPDYVSAAFDHIEGQEQQEIMVGWLRNNEIVHVGISYRLDPEIAVHSFGMFFHLLDSCDLIGDNKQVKNIYFSGLKPVCKYIDMEYRGRVITFCGGESAEETLISFGVPYDDIPHSIINGCKYDREIHSFGKSIIDAHNYKKILPIDDKKYSEYGTKNDSLVKRLYNRLLFNKQPLFRAHAGPYDATIDRRECVERFFGWCRELSRTGYLDILSVGASQLSQSHFGYSWENMTNGGGVPVNSADEYREIWEASQPMLVRTYSGTRNIEAMASLYDNTINMAWHALSLWWFNELDGRGPNTLYANLKEHIDTIKYIAKVGKPFEANVSHHFAFRGCDDVTYIVVAYLSAKLAKKLGVKIFILQNMLNTPRCTWGIQDLAKSRALLKMINELSDDSFKVVLQTRAGLDYFKPDIEEAKIQLAAVTALMDDIEPDDVYSPAIIHVVSYSEALYLATPEIINDSIKITREALKEYRILKLNTKMVDAFKDDIQTREAFLESSARSIVDEMEKHIKDLYSPEGLYLAFVSGWLPTPDLWNKSEEFAKARDWNVCVHNGGKYVCEGEVILPTDTRINRCVLNLDDAMYKLKTIHRFSKII